MLFGSSSASTKPKREEKKERKNEREEKFEVQESVFTRWANVVLDEASQYQQDTSSFSIQELKDFSDLRFLSSFCQLITGTATQSTGNQADDIDMIFHNLITVSGFEEDKILQISINDVCEGIQRAVLTMCWQLIQIYWRRFAPSKVRERKVTEVLKDWCLEATSPSDEVRVGDFTSSWRDGIALNVLLRFHNNSLVDLPQIRELRGDERIENAINLARKHYKAPRLIHAKEFHSEHLDTKSVACYLMMLYLSINSSRPAPISSKLSKVSETTSTPPTSTKHSKQFSAGGSSLQSLQMATGTPNTSIIEFEKQRQETPPSPNSKKHSMSVASTSSSSQIGASQQQQPHSAVVHPATIVHPTSGPQQFSPKTLNAPGTQNPQISPLAAVGTNTSATLAAAQQQYQLQMEIQKQQQLDMLKQQQQSDLLKQQQLQKFHQEQLLQQQQQQKHHQIQQQIELQHQQKEQQQQEFVSKQQQQQPAGFAADSSSLLTSMSSTATTIIPAQSNLSVAATVDVPHDSATFFLNEGALTTEIPSRKSSSSSQKSHSRRSSKGRKPQEDVIRDYESCLEQVLTWLLEAEHELHYMDSERRKVGSEPSEMIDDFSDCNLATVKKKFREHEQFMKSLTESQDSVGRVLHRGQQLSQRLEQDSEQAVGILNQLLMVNERWERIREAAMFRQRALQNQLNRLQRDHLQDISEWLTQFEKIIGTENLQRLAGEPNACRHQIVEHAQIQKQIDIQQPSIRRLSSFIAVVDPSIDEKPEDTKSGEEVSQLETLLHSVGERWTGICEWAEKRSRHLDGLAELLEHYNLAFSHLSNWLSERKNELHYLRNPDTLRGDEEYREQMNILHKMESALEQEHSSFVQLSQHCSELVQRFEQGKNMKMAEKIRHQLDEITESWDNIVTHLEEHSQMLVRSGKAKSSDSQRSGADRKLSRGKSYNPENDNLEKANAIGSDDKCQRMENNHGIQPDTEPAVDQAESELSSAAAALAEAEQSLIAREFVASVNLLEREIRPLIEWAHGFQISMRREDVRQMVQICQRKLKEIKDVEPRVTKLQIELERIHLARGRSASLNADHLHTVNEAFERFMHKWSAVVAKISDSLNTLSNPPSSSEEGDTDMILVRMTAWIKSASKVLNNIARDAKKDDNTAKRQRQSIDTITDQLSEHQRHVGYLKRRFEVADSEESLKRQQSLLKVELELINLVKRVESFRRGEHREAPSAQLMDAAGTEPSSDEMLRLALRPTTVVQLKQKLHSTTSGEMDDSPPRQSADQGQTQQEINPFLSPSNTDEEAMNYSPEPPPHEAETLRHRLEMEAAQHDESAAKNKNQPNKTQVEELADWVSDRELELKFGEATPGNVNELKEELLRIDGLIAEIREKLFHEMQLKKDNDYVNTSALDKFLRSAETKRNNIVDSINKTQLAIHKFVKAEECADRHKIALDRVKIKSAEKDIRMSETDLKALHHALTVEDWPLRSEAINLLEDIALSASTAIKSPQERREAVVYDMHSRVTRLAKQWDDLCAEIAAVLESSAANHRQKAEKALRVQVAIVTEMQDAVRASADATDAEELSEHLDNLERLLERLSNCEANNDELLQDFYDITEQVSSQPSSSVNIDTGLVNLINEYHRERDAIVPIARERCERLRSAVTKCDYFEQALCNCQSWCNYMHHILNLRISSDIHALDVPHEYKQAFEAGTLFPQMDKEFEEYDKLIVELNEFIETNKSQWSSNDRLRLQSEHAASQLGELRVKYNEFKQPVLLGDRIEKIERRLGEIECAIDDLTGIEAANCEYCLTHCHQLRKQLGAHDLAAECSALENIKEAFIRDAFLNEAQVIKIADKVSELQQKCAQLEERAGATCDRLERCVSLIKKLDKESDEVERAICAVEENIAAVAKKIDVEQSREGQRRTPSKDLLDRLSQLNAQIRSAVDVSKKTRELETLLKQNSIRLSTAMLDEISGREAKILSLKRQIGIWTESIQTILEDNSSVFSSFEKLADELQDKLTKEIEADSSHIKLRDLTASGEELSEDLNSPMYEQLETKAMKLVSRLPLSSNEEIVSTDGRKDSAENMRRIITQRLAEINVLRQLYARKKAAKAAAVELSSAVCSSNNEGPLMGTPSRDDYSQADSTVRRNKNVQNLPRLRSQTASGHRRKSDTSTTTINDASSISSHSGSTDGALAVRSNSLSLDAKSRQCLEDFENALAYLDFHRFPISSLEDWQDRLKTLSNWMAENRPRVDELLDAGKSIAESGGTDNNNLLASLDRLIGITNKIDFDAMESEKLLRLAESKRHTLRQGIENVQAQTTRYHETNIEMLNNSEIVDIQSALMESYGQLRLLQLTANELNNTIPRDGDDVADSGKMCSPFVLENGSLEALNLQLHEIENRIQDALAKALHVQEMQSALTAQSADRMSLSSGAGLSLAMDVHETEPEEEQKERTGMKNLEKQISNDKPPSSDNLHKFFVNLDTIEDFLEKPEHLPFEGLNEKQEILRDFDFELSRGEFLVEDNQMTMGLAESEHAIQRIRRAREFLGERRSATNASDVTLKALQTHFSQTDDLIVTLGVSLRRLGSAARTSPKRADLSRTQSHVHGQAPRNRSPDLDELEATQLELEDQLPPIAVHIQQSANRLEAIGERFSSEMRNSFNQRLEQCRADFISYSNQIRQSRRHLEEQLADQTHLTNQAEMLEFWCDEMEAGIVNSDVKCSALSAPAQLHHMLKDATARSAELPEKLMALRTLENLRDRFVALANVEPEIKHEIRRKVAEVAKRVSDVKYQLGEKLEELQKVNEASNDFWRNFQAIDNWLVEAVAQLDSVRDATIYRPSLGNIEKLHQESSKFRGTLMEMNAIIEEEMLKSANTNNGQQNGSLDKKERKNQKKFENLLKEFHSVTNEVEKVLNENSELLRAIRKTSDDDQDKTDNTGELAVDRLNNKNLSNAETIIKPKAGINLGSTTEGTGSFAPSTTEYGTLSNNGSASGPPSGGNSDEVNNNNINKNGYFDRRIEERASQRRPRRMSVGEQARLDTVTRFASWLEELQRDAAVSVDLSDQHIVRQAMGKAQNWIDELNVNQVEVLRVVDEARDKLVIERAQICSQQMEKVLMLCQRRRTELQTILEECRAWEQLRYNIEMWLNEADEKLTSGTRVNELTDAGLVEQLEVVAELSHESAKTWRERLARFNVKSNTLLDTHRRDDGHNLSHLTSKLNTHWTKFNDALRIRRAVLEAAKRSRQDFHSALGQLQQWLSRQSVDVFRLDNESGNAQLLKDTSRRREWMAQEKECRAEIDAHHDVMDSVKQMGRKLLEELEASEEREQLRERLENVYLEWQQLTEKSQIIKNRLENAQEECETLTQNLSDFLYWTDQQLKTIANAQPVGGDLAAVQNQFEIIKTIERTMEARERKIQDCIQLAHSYLMQHDLRPAIHTPSVLEPATVDEDGFTALTDAQREEHRVGVQIFADSEKLKKSWELLRKQCANWSGVVSRAHRDMHELDATIAEALLSLGAIEDDFHQLPVVETLRLEELKDARLENTTIRKRTFDASTRLDDVNDCAGQIAAKNIALSSHVDDQIQAINQRFEKIKRDIACRGAALERAFNDFGPSSEHFLVDSVLPPWQRAISTPNQLPYYIDHNTEVTQWDHPVMVDILEQLSTFNQVKFSAYRTAMKLRAIQKRLCLDLIELPDLDESIEQRLKNCVNEEHMRMEDAVMCLVPLFEAANARFPHLLKNVPMAVDLALNLLLNIYDACRDGKLRVLSFKIALVVMCNATLESKYKYLFRLVSTSNGVDQKALAILLYDLIHLPKFLGESAAFGGLNIEPSVRSCFEHAKFSLKITVQDFLEWLKKEPQSLVWLPVMHRLASSEFAKHSAKCNACKMFPIVGMRYRCLRCFNFDICQSCFFSQRTAKNHKLTHPMQEYCLPTNPRDDMRDFTAMMRNKVRRAKSRVGYLPVEQAIEGVPLEQSEQTPQNSSSEAMHQRMHLFAQRLDAKRVELEASGVDTPKASPPPQPSQAISDGVGGGTAKSVSMGAIPMSLATRRASGPGGERENKQVQIAGQGSNPMVSPAIHGRQKSEDTKVEVKSPSQIMTEAELMRKEELDQVLQKLQYENLRLKMEVEKRRRAVGVGPAQSAKSTPNLSANSHNADTLQFQHRGPPTIIQQQPLGNDCYFSGQTPAINLITQTPNFGGAQFDNGGDGNMPLRARPAPPPPVPRHGIAPTATPVAQVVNGSQPTRLDELNEKNGFEENQDLDDELTEHKTIEETHCLRLHQQRLEQRSRVLEEHNRQLQQHLERLQSRLINEKQKSMGALSKLDENSELNAAMLNGDGIPPPPVPLSWTTLPTAHQYAPYGPRHMGSAPYIGGGYGHVGRAASALGGVSSSEDDDPLGRYGTEIRRHHMQKLMSTVDELNRAIESFVGTVVVDPEDPSAIDEDDEIVLDENETGQNGTNDTEFQHRQLTENY